MSTRSAFAVFFSDCHSQCASLSCFYLPLRDESQEKRHGEPGKSRCTSASEPPQCQVCIPVICCIACNLFRSGAWCCAGQRITATIQMFPWFQSK